MAVPEHDSCGVAFLADRRGSASREIVDLGLRALPRVPGRGDSLPSGSPPCAGILTAVPWSFFGSHLPPPLSDGHAHRIAAMFALDPQQAERAISAARWALRRLGWHVMAWREVPVCTEALAPEQRATAPRIVQCFARASHHRHRRTPYRTRLAIEARWLRLGLSGCSVTSLSDATIAYKGLVAPADLCRLFPDLADSRFTSPFAVLHSGFSPRTVPRWDLAQPFHAIAHIGEIATIRGNRQWMDVRIADAGIRDETDLLKDGGSDSQTLDAAVQWLCEAGLSMPHALGRLLPPAWEHDSTLAPEVRAFHRHEACFAESWEGSTSVAFADGRYVGVVLDRHGSRPLHTAETDDFVCAASQFDAFELAGTSESRQPALGAGDMLVLDLVDRAVLRGESVRRQLAARKNYIDLASRLIQRIPQEASAAADESSNGRAVSLRTLLGRRGQWSEHALPPVILELDSPVLRDTDLDAILSQSRVRAAVLPIGFDPGAATSPAEALQQALATLQSTAAALAANGTRILVLSDRRMNPAFVPIPSLLATAAVDSGLRSARLRLRASILADASDIRDGHDTAALLSFGASAVVPHAAPERSRRRLETDLQEILSTIGVFSLDAYSAARMLTTVSLDDLAHAALRHPQLILTT